MRCRNSSQDKTAAFAFSTFAAWVVGVDYKGHSHIDENFHGPARTGGGLKNLAVRVYMNERITCSVTSHYGGVISDPEVWSIYQIERRSGCYR